MWDFHFLRPWWWLALPVIMLLLYGYFRHAQQINNWTRVCDAHLLQYLQQQHVVHNKKWPVLLTSYFVVITVALAGPSWQRKPQPIYQSTVTHVIVLDVSSAMLGNDLTPSRLARAKFKIVDLLSQLDEGYIGLVAFSDEAYVVTPLTKDRNTIKHLLSVLHPDVMPSDGENIAAGLAKALELLNNQHSQKGEVILFTANTPDWLAEKETAKLQRQGYQLSVVDVTTAAGSPIPLANGFQKDRSGNMLISRTDATQLQQLASLTPGIYQRLSSNDSDITALLAASPTPERQAEEQQENLGSQFWQDNGYWLIFLLLPAVLFAFRRGGL